MQPAYVYTMYAFHLAALCKTKCYTAGGQVQIRNQTSYTYNVPCNQHQWRPLREVCAGSIHIQTSRPRVSTVVEGFLPAGVISFGETSAALRIYYDHLRKHIVRIVGTFLVTYINAKLAQRSGHRSLMNNP